ncbi:cytochrome ubiquinol oxidase subunit I [Thermocatellispora tengchongensis]|uniref:cytochrome ubiquinol oxidase subunit I n=1 Tax=Thermocatellispora tengchongensis TaxID=1073253 RepID=UPI00363EE5B2
MQTWHAVSGKPVWERMTRFWGQIYVINYALGVFTGLVMEFQFGLSWSGLSHYAGEVFGPPLATETLVAFFLESTFLGLWIFGWHRLPKWAHLACIWMVTLTAYASAYWIMVANAFLQNPAGAVARDGHLALTDVGALLTNPALVFALPHVAGAAMLTGGFVVVGASAYHLLRRHPEQGFFATSMRLGIVWAGIGVFVTSGFGFAQFAALSDYQPDKFDGGAPAVSLGFMILIGELFMLAMMFFLLPVVYWLPRWRWTHPILMLMTPLPFVASILGWLAREVGRQPWMINGKLTVADALTPGLTPAMITGSFAAFTLLLGALAIVDYALIVKTVRRGPAGAFLGARDDGAPDPSPPPR